MLGVRGLWPRNHPTVRSFPQPDLITQPDYPGLWVRLFLAVNSSACFVVICAVCCFFLPSGLFLQYLRHVARDVRTYNAAISACERASEWLRGVEPGLYCMNLFRGKSLLCQPKNRRTICHGTKDGAFVLMK